MKTFLHHEHYDSSHKHKGARIKLPKHPSSSIGEGRNIFLKNNLRVFHRQKIPMQSTCCGTLCTLPKGYRAIILLIIMQRRDDLSRNIAHQQKFGVRCHFLGYFLPHVTLSQPVRYWLRGRSFLSPVTRLECFLEKSENFSNPLNFPWNFSHPLTFKITP